MKSLGFPENHEALFAQMRDRNVSLGEFLEAHRDLLDPRDMYPDEHLGTILRRWLFFTQGAAGGHVTWGKFRSEHVGDDMIDFMRGVKFERDPTP